MAQGKGWKVLTCSALAPPPSPLAPRRTAQPLFLALQRAVLGAGIDRLQCVRAAPRRPRLCGGQLPAAGRDRELGV